MSREIPTCPKCYKHGGLSINKDSASWICPDHGAFQSISVKRLNGEYDEAKWGGSNDD